MANVSLTCQQLETLLPRRYQEEVFTRAQKGNIIAALNTGSGKTLISLLLIKWTMAKEQSKGKVIIFLVPKVTLVEQQCLYIDKNTPDSIRVMKLHGALDIDLGDRAGWKKRFEEHEVLVMTAQIFLNILTHSVWSIDKVSLMIFDECHHARKNHPYNGIMREYFHVPSSRRPKIFGMTASPIWNIKDPAGSLATLEQNMDAKVIGVRDHIEELVDHSPKPIEVIEEYPSPPEEYDYPFPTIYMCLQIFEKTIWDQLDIPWSKIEMRYFSTLHNLGPYCASLFLFLEIQHHLTNLFAECQKYLYPVDGDMAVDVPSSTPAKRIPLEIFDIDDIVSDFRSFFSSDDCPAQIPIPIPLSWCSPKVESLVKVLLKYSSPTFQGIIFVEQRQVALTLGRLLEAVPELQDTIRCAHLVGQGVNSEGVSRHSDRYQGDAVKLFRDKEINILIATSVAEEGLDFPACDLVVRFDPLQHLVGYVQSRGRARNKASTFIIMIQKDDLAQLTRYKALQEREPEINKAYQTRHLNTDDDLEDDDDDDKNDLVDLAERERYVVPSTGAILSYDNAINLIHRLCALIPRDAFTPPHQPTFTGSFQSTMRLPPSLPLPPRHLSYLGPPKRSKKEAKRAVAFCAVKRLCKLDVFDDYLLPISSQVHEEDKQRVTRVRNVPAIMTVSVRDPWCMGSKLWIHPIFIDGCQVAGLVTGTKLPPVEVLAASSHVRTGLAELLVFHEDLEFEERKIMHDFTKLGIWYRITSSPFVSATSLFLIPLTGDNQPDFPAMTRLVDNPWGREDWGSVTEDDYDRRIVMSTYEKGRTYLLKKIRDDLSPMSVPTRGSSQAAFPTYHEYFVSKWTRKRPAIVPVDGPLLEAAIHPKSHLGSYSLYPTNRDTIAAPSNAQVRLLPQGCTRWIDLSFDLCRAFEALPVICRRLTDVYRIQCGRFELGLPLITENLLIEAFTLPSSKPSCNNQRMETLGDAVLQICTTVHLLNAYPNRHEGQLTDLRQQFVSNNYLLSRAKDVGLERFLTSEVETVHKWRYTLPDDGNGEGLRDLPKLSAEREYPRRSLQDCMEAVLGASFLTGGISMALATGTALGLAFGGPHPWWRRYPPSAPPTAVSALFEGLETSLGYKFHHNHLILEAVTHPSFTSSGGPSYQRLEFLGDALLDLVVIKYLYDKFPSATSHELAFPRTRTICAQTLAHVAVKRLGLHNIMLVNCPALMMAINGYVPMLKAASSEEIVNKGWKYDPPKALSDVFESVMGAIFVDTGYDYDKTASVIEYVMEDVLSVLSPSLTKDPVSDLLEWAGKAGCMKVVFGRKMKSTGKLQAEGVTVSVHGNIVIGPIVSTSLPVAKYAAAERAMAMLKDGETDKSLAHLCDCGKHMEIDSTEPALVEDGAKLDVVFDEELDAEEAAEVDHIMTTELS